MLIYSQNTYIGQSKDSCLGRSEQDIVRFHHATEHDVQFRIYDLFISRIFYLLFLEANRKWNCGYCNPTLFWMQHNLESRLLGEIPITSDMQMTWPLWQKAKVKVKSLSCVWLCETMDCSLSGSSVHGIFQTRILEWVVISFSRGSSQPRDWTWVSHIAGRF